MPETKPYKPAVDKTAAPVTINLVKLQSLFPARVIYIGRVSGKRYDFPEAGSILEVDAGDVPDMLAYRIGTTNCCGGGNVGGNVVFQTV